MYLNIKITIKKITVAKDWCFKLHFGELDVTLISDLYFGTENIDMTVAVLSVWSFQVKRTADKGQADDDDSGDDKG